MIETKTNSLNLDKLETALYLRDLPEKDNTSKEWWVSPKTILVGMHDQTELDGLVKKLWKINNNAQFYSTGINQGIIKSALKDRATEIKKSIQKK